MNEGITGVIRVDPACWIPRPRLVGRDALSNDGSSPDLAPSTEDDPWKDRRIRPYGDIIFDDDILPLEGGIIGLRMPVIRGDHARSKEDPLTNLDVIHYVAIRAEPGACPNRRPLPDVGEFPYTTEGSNDDARMNPG